jgi:hypothetical protein
VPIVSAFSTCCEHISFSGRARCVSKRRLEKDTVVFHLASVSYRKWQNPIPRLLPSSLFHSAPHFSASISELFYHFPQPNDGVAKWHKWLRAGRHAITSCCPKKAWTVIPQRHPPGPPGHSGGKSDSGHSLDAWHSHVMPGIEGVWQPCHDSLGHTRYNQGRQPLRQAKLGKGGSDVTSASRKPFVGILWVTNPIR